MTNTAVICKVEHVVGTTSTVRRGGRRAGAVGSATGRFGRPGPAVVQVCIALFSHFVSFQVFLLSLISRFILSLSWKILCAVSVCLLCAVSVCLVRGHWVYLFIVFFLLLNGAAGA